MADNRGASIEIEGLVKRYGTFAAVDDVSLSIPAGEFVTLLGPSGSGKTTTLNLIAGFDQPDEGTIRIDGQSIDRLPPYKRDLGVVFQNYALFPHMTVSGNVEFPLKRRKVSKRDISQRVAASLELVGLSGFGERYPRELSGGQQQRVALARALVFEPRVLLMDEPLGALDKRLRETLQLEFRRIHAELGITFVYVTHDQEEALVMSDRIAVFSNGRIEQAGTAEDMYERPETLFVAEFLGDSNLIRGRLDVDGDTSVIHADGYEIVARHDNNLASGDQVAAMIRPEHVTLAAKGGSVAAGCNALDGLVDEVIYLGSSRRISVSFGSGLRLVSVVPAGGGDELTVGDAVVATWRPERSVTLLADSAAVARAHAAANVE